jgi:hypothetical protein
VEGLSNACLHVASLVIGFDQFIGTRWCRLPIVHQKVIRALVSRSSKSHCLHRRGPWWRGVWNTFNLVGEIHDLVVSNSKKMHQWPRCFFS